MKKLKQTELVIFTHGRQKVKLKGDFDRETLWASQAEIAAVFGVDVRTVNEHLNNIYKIKELEEMATIRKFRIVRKEGSREVEREIMHYNLDAIISVGYRVNSATATRFRQWATKTLREHITKGFTINPSRIEANYSQFMEAVESLKKLASAESLVDTESVLELVRLFADTWFALDAYDKEALTPKKVTKRSVKLTAELLLEGVAVLKTELMRKGEATENFAQERNRDSVEGIVGNVMQSFGGQPLYPSLEAKAAHLLYFIIKNHPFVDGNKRTGAYAFVWYLRKAKMLDTTRLTPAALTALTLLIAESDPKDKEKMIDLVVMLLAGPKRT
ncbi:MAG TPA: virulence protein RhuM/Fic/DOC family protein [Candidatus Paceibacterota bacterium]|nr:virulence protein RhuM/Fic/DOC family protein [Candidatus Paceibacterota bacterium]